MIMCVFYKSRSGWLKKYMNNRVLIEIWEIQNRLQYLVDDNKMFGNQMFAYMNTVRKG